MLHDAHPLRIEAASGRSRCLMVSFTSVGRQRKNWPPKEFVKMASQDGLNHVIAVTDISRSWMNGKGVARRIHSVISDYILANGITQVMALGSSMGAYCAMVLGRLMPLSRIIAFAPQYSVKPDIVPDEPRWWWFRKEIEDWPHPALDALPEAPAKIYMFHGDTEDEKRHWRRIGRAENLKHYIFAGSDHDFVARLKEASILHKLVRASINDNPGRLGKVVSRAGGMKRTHYEAFEAANDYFEAFPKLGKPEGLAG
ncbi:MAG: hypothetical protein AAF340_03920 [Pseudomonadota bacterium]